MPGGDRTGPAGLGPMTGRAAGYCAGYPVPGYMNPVGGRGRGFGRGWGRGRGRGFGRGWGFGRGFGWQGYGYPYDMDPYAGYPYAPEVAPQQETEMLKEQAKAIKEELGAINQRIKELEASAKTEKKK